MTDKSKWSVKFTDKFIDSFILMTYKLFELLTWDLIFKYCLCCALRHESDVRRGKLRDFYYFSRESDIYAQ